MSHAPRSHVTSPTVSAGSIIAMRCREGVIVGTDTLLCYGSLLSNSSIYRLLLAILACQTLSEYQDICRFEKISENVVVTATGDYADFQSGVRTLRKMTLESDIFDDGVTYSPSEYSHYLSQVSYNKRNNGNPLYNNFIFAGFEAGQPYLASVDLFGTHLVKDYFTVGFAAQFGLSIVSNEWSADLSLLECKEIMKKCFSVLFMRDCRTVDKVQFAAVTKDGVHISQVEQVPSNWDFKEFVERDNAKLWRVRV